MTRATLIFLGFLLLAPPAHAFDSDKKSTFLGLGILAENMNKYTTDPAATSSSFIGRTYVNLVLRSRLDISSGGISLSPVITFTPTGSGSPEGGETTRILSICPRLTLPFAGFDFSFGPGYLHRMVSASGGTVTLNNGGGTSQFALPPSSSSESLLIISTGLGIQISELRIDFDLWLSELGSSTRRAVDGLLTVSYGIF